jgi:hypothetical protein
MTSKGGVVARRVQHWKKAEFFSPRSSSNDKVYGVALAFNTCEHVSQYELRSLRAQKRIDFNLERSAKSKH